MKKIFSFIALAAIALFTTTALVSCGGDDDDSSNPSPSSEDYLAFQYWLTDDIFEIADVTISGLDNFKFSESIKYKDTDGKASNKVVLTGENAKNAEFSITVTLKKNWKEILGDRETLNIGSAKGIATTKSSTSGNLTLEGNVLKNLKVSEYDDEKMGRAVMAMGYTYKK